MRTTTRHLRLCAAMLWSGLRHSALVDAAIAKLTGRRHHVRLSSFPSFQPWTRSSVYFGALALTRLPLHGHGFQKPHNCSLHPLTPNIHCPATCPRGRASASFVAARSSPMQLAIGQFHLVLHTSRALPIPSPDLTFFLLTISLPARVTFCCVYSFLLGLSRAQQRLVTLDFLDQSSAQTLRLDK